MSRSTKAFMVFCLLILSCNGPGSGYNPGISQNDLNSKRIKSISFQNVVITDNFWRPRIDINRVTTIRHALQQASQSIENFDIASGKSKGEHKGNIAGD